MLSKYSFKVFGNKHNLKNNSWSGSLSRSIFYRIDPGSGSDAHQNKIDPNCTDIFFGDKKTVVAIERAVESWNTA